VVALIAAAMVRVGVSVLLQLVQPLVLQQSEPRWRPLTTTIAMITLSTLGADTRPTRPAIELAIAQRISKGGFEAALQCAKVGFSPSSRGVGLTTFGLAAFLDVTHATGSALERIQIG
jgi:hypothetical protein